MVEVDSTHYSWVHLGVEPVPAGQDTISNPTNEILTEIRGMSTGDLDIAVLHRGMGGVVTHVQYEPFEVTETTVCWLSLENSTEDFGIRIDFEGDGTVDHIHYPEGDVSGVDVQSPVSISRFYLYDAYPNPFNPITTISYEAVNGTHAHLAVYDVAGRLVRVLVDEKMVSSSRQEVLWNGRDSVGRTVSAGVYFYRLEAGSFSETKRMVTA